MNSAETLLKSGKHKAISAGLYTYAIEEHGKILLLKRYSPKDGSVKIKYRNEFRNHYKKFKIAITNLPIECTILGHEGFDPTGFEKGFETKDVITDFEARMAVFYSDLLYSEIKIKPVPSVDEKLLRNAIIKLREIVMEL